MMRKPHLVLLVAALLVGGTLRINGIAWGLPDGVHANYSYHPDEAFLLQWAADLYQGKIVSKQFIYGGTFYASTLEAARHVADAMTVDRQATLRDRILAARGASALFALLAILTTYFAGATLFGCMSGAWAAVVMALAPGHIIAAQIARPDSLFTLLLCLNLLFAARLVRGCSSVRWNLIGAAVVLGVAVATRFPAALWWLGHVGALVMAARTSALRGRVLLRSVAQLSAIAGLTYLIASPQSVMYFPALIDGLNVQFAYQRGASVEQLTSGVGGWRYGGSIMAEALGYGFYLPALAAIALAAWRRTRADVLVALFVVPYFLALTTTHWVVVRYFVPLLPLLAIWIGGLIQRSVTAHGLQRTLAIALCIGAVTVNALASAIYTAAVCAPDTRDQALRWLLTHAAPATHIGVLQAYDGDVYFHPPAISHFNWSACVLSSCDLAQFFSGPAQLLVIADNYLDEVTIDGRRSQVASALAAQTTYEPIARFAPSLIWHGYDVTPQFRAPDVRDALTGLTIFRRRATAP